MARQQTGISNHQYDLISAIYHFAQGAQTHEAYVKDAEKAGDDQLADYFREVQKEYRTLAEKGEKLLAERIAK